MSKGSGNPFSSNLQRDASATPFQSGNAIQTSDASDTPKTSPLAYSSTEIALQVPDRAVEVAILPSSDLRVSEVTGMTQYYVQPSGTIQAYGIAASQYFYIKRDTADGTLNFYFIII